MYLEATVTVDPSQLTEIGPVMPTKVFAKLASGLSGGLASKHEEQETFTAVAILQQLNMVLRLVGVDDIVRIEELEAAFNQHMNVDAVQTAVRSKIIRPNGRVERRNDIPHASDGSPSDPAFYDYHGGDDAFFYAWLWADQCHTHNVHCHDCVLVDDWGRELAAIDSGGLDAGSSEVMNVETPFESTSVSVGELQTGGDAGSDVAAKLDAGLGGGSEGGGWLSSFMDSVGDFSFGGDGGDGGGGSSCGGGCGGCGGG